MGATRSKCLLMESCGAGSAETRLHALGILLGVREWTGHYQTRVQDAHESIVKKCKEQKQLLEASKLKKINLSRTVLI